MHPGDERAEFGQFAADGIVGKQVQPAEFGWCIFSHAIVCKVEGDEGDFVLAEHLMHAVKEAPASEAFKTVAENEYLKRSVAGGQKEPGVQHGLIGQGYGDMMNLGHGVNKIL